MYQRYNIYMYIIYIYIYTYIYIYIYIYVYIYMCIYTCYIVIRVMMLFHCMYYSSIYIVYVNLVVAWTVSSIDLYLFIYIESTLLCGGYCQTPLIKTLTYYPEVMGRRYIISITKQRILSSSFVVCLLL